jgi:uncharacterized glyoxalase superfamily protein PhnB
MLKIAKMPIYVKNQNEALRYYTEKLGFEIRDDVTNGDFRWLTVGSKDQPDMELILMPLKPDHNLSAEDVQVMSKLVENGKLAHHVWHTDDVKRLYETLSAKGALFVMPPTDRPYGVIEAILKDNSGNVFVLHQEKK